ncbi:MAG: phage holin family protein [Hyphomicrobiaceae bacterium]
MSDKNRSITELIPQLGTEVVRLMKSEADLLRAELNEKAEHFETAIGSMVAGGVFLVAALVILLQALVVALANAGMDTGWSALLVGAVAAAVGAGLVLHGSGKTSLTPRKSLRELRKTANMVREKAQ